MSALGVFASHGWTTCRVGRRSRAFLALGWVVLAYIVGFTFASFAGVFK